MTENQAGEDLASRARTLLSEVDPTRGRHGGRRTIQEVADILGVDRTTLWRSLNPGMVEAARARRRASKAMTSSQRAVLGLVRACGERGEDFATANRNTLKALKALHERGLIELWQDPGSDKPYRAKPS